MTKDEALKLALEALEGVLDDAPKVLNASIAGGLYEVIQCRDAITAIKKALAQPEQEPLEYWNAVEGWVKIDEVRQHFDSVGCGTIYKTAGEGREPLYTTPPQRKPLTEQEIGAILEDINAFGTRLYTFARAIEAAHGIKENT